MIILRITVTMVKSQRFLFPFRVPQTTSFLKNEMIKRRRMILMHVSAFAFVKGRVVKQQVSECLGFKNAGVGCHALL